LACAVAGLSLGACGDRATLSGDAAITRDASTSTADGPLVDSTVDAPTGRRLLEGQRIPLGNGEAWTWALVEPDFTVVEVGLAVTRGALEAAASPWVHSLDFPPVARVKSFFDHVTLSLAHQPAIGGSPDARPYLEAHFFAIDQQARRGIDCRDARLPLWGLPSPYQLPRQDELSCVLQRGFHALPARSTAEPPGFDSALAADAGQLIAVNVVVDRNWWKRGEPHRLTFALPEKLPRLASWPTRLSVSLDANEQVYRFAFDQLVQVPFGYDPRPPPPPLDAGTNFGPRPDAWRQELPCGGDNKPCEGRLPVEPL
jgi:hypothetical protein